VLRASADLAQRLLVNAAALRIDEALQVEGVVGHRVR